jgi:hypothetical protein
MSLAVLSGRRAIRPAPQPRPPLPPLPPGSYDRTLPWTLPRTRDVLRADLWGVPVYAKDGTPLPFVPRGSREHPERALTYFLYKPEWQGAWVAAVLYAHAIRAYTHFYLSWPDARDDGGLSIAQFVALCRYVKSWGFWVGVFLGAKGRAQGNDIDGDPRDQSPTEWQARVQPILDALLNADAADEFVPAWEYDLFNRDGTWAIEYPRWVGVRVHSAGKSCWMHFSTHVTSWHPQGRFYYWSELGDAVDGLHYQGDATWDIATYQARLVDTLKQFGEEPGQPHKLRATEIEASAEFSVNRPDENDASLMGFLLCCTRDNVGHTDARVWGYGNGGAQPDGSAL